MRWSRITRDVTVGLAAVVAAQVTCGLSPVSASSACDARVAVAIPAPTVGLSWSENVGYDDRGGLWVSRTLAGVVDRYDRAGRRTASVRVAWPGAVRLGPDGSMYATSGDHPVNLVPGLPRTGTVVAFDPQAARPVARTVVRGLGMPNGLAFDDDGAMYVADSAVGVVRIEGGRIDWRWTGRAPKNLAPSSTVNGTGMNGIVIRGDAAYVTMTTSLTGRVLRIPLADPASYSVAADLTAPLPGVLDDLVDVGDDVVAVAASTGQVVLSDLRTGRRCAVGVGQPATSVAVNPAGGLMVGTESGDVLRVG